MSATIHAIDSSKPQSKREIHPESLLQIPLLRQMMSDPVSKIQFRAIDSGWKDNRIIPPSVSGFNPTHSRIYVARKSSFAKWIQDPYSSARWYNEHDRLITKVLFSIHDYLHNWSYNAINHLLPHLKFGSGKITRKNIEDFVFCHLLTEAVATVGLDYWYLSTVNLNDVCNIGTQQGPLTVSYREEYLPEYRRLIPNLEVQSKEFFNAVAAFYCQGGQFLGISPIGLERHPMTYRWLNHEITYGESQREYARLWFYYLGKDQRNQTSAQLRAPVDASQKWKQQLIHRLGEMLWEKVKEDKMHGLSATLSVDNSWKGPTSTDADFRFVNLWKASKKEIDRAAVGKNPDGNFSFLFYQYVSQFDFEAFDKQLLKLFPSLITTKDFGLVEYLFKNQKRLEPAANEPRDLFMLN